MIISEILWSRGYLRRRSLQALAGFFAASPFARAQQDPFRGHPRIPKLDELATAFDFEPVFHAQVPRSIYDYTMYGVDSEFTLRRNRQAFDWVRLLPGAAGAATPSTSTTILGTPMAFPFLIAPTAGHGQLHPEAEMATYRGAEEAGATMIVSNVSSLPFEKIVTAAKSPLWFQLYPRPEMEANAELLERVQAAGARAVVVTIDQQASVYERALHGRNLAASPPRAPRGRGGVQSANKYRVNEGRLWYEWKLFDELRKMIRVPMAAKGILTAEDARLCLDHGVDAIYVSNHGGRSLDYGPSTLEVLPEIVQAVGGRVPVLFDSGVRRGADALKAMALGASAVGLGRVSRWGLGAYGTPGVKKILEIVQQEFVHAMRNAGCASLASIDASLAKVDLP